MLKNQDHLKKLIQEQYRNVISEQQPPINLSVHNCISKETKQNKHYKMDTNNFILSSAKMCASFLAEISYDPPPIVRGIQFEFAYESLCLRGRRE